MPVLTWEQCRSNRNRRAAHTVHDGWILHQWNDDGHICFHHCEDTIESRRRVTEQLGFVAHTRGHFCKRHSSEPNTTFCYRASNEDDALNKIQLIEETARRAFYGEFD